GANQGQPVHGEPGSWLGGAATRSTAKRYVASGGTDYATTDSPYSDFDHPPIHFPHFFMTQGKPIQSFIWLANGKEAKGCFIFPPQAFGGDSLDSLVPGFNYERNISENWQLG